MAKNIVLDLETLSTRPNAVIATLGAYVVDLDNFSTPMPTPDQIADHPDLMFYQVIDADSCVKRGLHMDPRTILWWMRQSDQARIELSKPGLDLAVVLSGLGEWMLRGGYRASDLRIWGHGANFDPVITDEAYKACGIPVPWDAGGSGYRAVRCTRTTFDLYGVRPESQNLHHALWDAYSEAMALRICYLKRHMAAGLKHLAVAN